MLKNETSPKRENWCQKQIKKLFEVSVKQPLLTNLHQRVGHVLSFLILLLDNEREEFFSGDADVEARVGLL